MPRTHLKKGHDEKNSGGILLFIPGHTFLKGEGGGAKDKNSNHLIFTKSI